MRIKLLLICGVLGLFVLACYQWRPPVSGQLPGTSGLGGSSDRYTLAEGENFAQVAAKFSLDQRTLQCANPDWQPGQTEIILPITSARRHRVKSGETLAQLAEIYQVAPAVISDYSLNFWQGCPGLNAVSKVQTGPALPAGLILYIPDPVNPRSALATGQNKDLPAGEQALSDNYQAEDAPYSALTNPYPASFQLPAAVVNPTVNPSPTATAVPPKPTVAVFVPPPAVSRSRVIGLVGPVGSQLDKEITPAAGHPLIWPIRGVITTNFSAAHPAIDISNTAGTPIYAAQSGVVFYAAMSPYGYGNLIKIDHGDGRHTHYGHFSSVVVQEGQKVSQGQLLGYEGSTGHSTGPHLHFELVVNGRYVDPLLNLPK